MKEKDGVRLRHALEVRNPTFATEQFYDLARQYGAAIVYAVDDEEPTWPQIDEATADFTYATINTAGFIGGPTTSAFRSAPAPPPGCAPWRLK